MKRIIATSASVLLVLASVAWAQDDVASLLSEMKGEAPAKQRTAEQWQAAYAKVIDSMMKDLAAEDTRARETAQTSLERIAFHASRPNAEDQRQALAKAIVPKLGESTPKEARLWLIRMLQHTGRAECVGALAALLDDKDVEISDSARRALQKNRSDEAGVVLRGALGKAATPEARIAYANALGGRKDKAAVGAIASLLSDKDAAVVMSAARALGNIGGADAAKALMGARGAPENVRPVVIDAYLLCADQLVVEGKKDDAAAIYQQMYAPAEPVRVRIAALRGLVMSKPAQAAGLLGEAITGKDGQLQATAIRLAADIQGPEATAILTGLIPRVPPAVQAALVAALGSRHDAGAKPTVIEATRNSDDAVRVAAFKALGELGGASDVPLLAKTAAGQGADADAARQGLLTLRGADVDSAMLKQFDGGDAKLRAEIIKVLAARRSAAAMPAFAKAAQEGDESVQVEAINALGALGDERTLPLLVGIIGKTPSARVRDTAESAVRSIAVRLENKSAAADCLLGAVGGAGVEAKCALLRLLPTVGGEKSLAAVRAALKDAKPEVQEAATRALSNWPDAGAVPDVLAMAKDASLAQKLQILALQGYIRLANVPQDRPAADKVKMYQEAMDLAKRVDEKRMILSGLGDTKVVEALRLVIPCLDQKDVQNEACSAAAKIGKELENTSAAKEDLITAMEKVLTLSKDKRITGDAQKTLDKAKKMKGK